MGLLDLLSSDEAALGLGLLAAGGPTTDPNRSGFGQRMAAGVQYAQGNADNRLRRQFQQSQIDENKAQSDMQRQKLAMSQRQMDMDAQFLGLAPGPSVAAAAGMQAPPSAAPQPMGGAIPERAAGLPKAVEAFAQGTPATFGGVALTAQQISQKYGIPVEAIINDYRNNGGKKISEFIMSKGTPDMQVSNGYAYDKNRLAPGFLPSLTTSTSGQTSMTQIQDGLPVVSAPRGALDTYAAYQGISNRSSADYKPERVLETDPSSPNYGRTVVKPTSQVLQPGTAGGYGTERDMRATAAGDMGADPKALAREIRATQNDMMKPGLDEPSRAALRAHLADLQGQGQRIGAPAVSGNVVDLSPAELAANEAARARAVDTAKADVTRDTATQKKEKSAGEMIAAVRRARQLLQEGPTASGIGDLVDKGASFFGESTKGAEVAAKLDIIAGDLKNNVPRMEGPQSDGDRIDYSIQAGRAADRSVPVKQRLAAMDEVEKLQMKYAKLNGGSPGAEGSWEEARPKAKVLEALPTPNSSNKGQRIRDTTTGKILKSNGLQWKEE